MKELATKAKDNYGYTYDVVVTQAAQPMPILKIVNTPGSWYISTLRNHGSKIISLDWGQNWNCVNFDEIACELIDLGFNL